MKTVETMGIWIDDLRTALNLRGSEKSRVEVIEGSNGVLFLNQGAAETKRQITGESRLDANALGHIHAIHSERTKLCAKLGIAYRHVICPNKEAVETANLPERYRYESVGPSFVTQYLAKYPEAASYYDPAVLKEVEGAYYRTDSVWSEKGALAYLRAALAHFDDRRALERLDGMRMETVERERLGDLGLRLGWPPERCKGLLIPTRSAHLALEGNITGDGYVRLERSIMENSARRKALVLHDSFTTALYLFLAECYRETLFLHLPHFDTRFVTQYRPDVVWFFQAERYFPRVPKNHIDYADWVERQERRKGRAEHGSRFLRLYCRPRT